MTQRSKGVTENPDTERTVLHRYCLWMTSMSKLDGFEETSFHVSQAEFHQIYFSGIEPVVK